MQPVGRQETFMRGAMLITFSALVSRVLGALYRPIGQHFLGDQALAWATAPNAAYQIIFAVSSVGLNVAVSRLVSERLALEDYRGARRVFQVATGMLTISGAVFAVGFAIASPWIAHSLQYDQALPGFLALAPALFLVALLSVFRGLYQGMQQMAPSAASQVLEQVGRVVVGIILVAALTPVALNYGAAAFNAGNTIGVAIGVLYSWWVYTKDRPTAGWTTTAPGIPTTADDSTGSVMRKILAISIPLSLIGAILPIMQLIDTSVVTNRLVAVGVNLDAAQQAFAYLTNSATLRDLPSILTVALYISLVPAVTEAIAKGRTDQARQRSETALRLAWLFGIPATLGLAVGAKDAYSIFFTGGGYTTMAPLAWSVVFLMVQQTTSGSLQGMGYIWRSVSNMLLGVLVKTVLTYWWTSVPGLYENGAAYATSVGVAVSAFLNLWMLHQRMGLRIRWIGDIVRPTAAAAMMSAGIWLASPLVHRVIHSARLAGLVTIGIGGVIYLVAIFVVGGITESDLRILPGMRPKVVDWLKQRGLVRG